jgi:hypothetical protein
VFAPSVEALDESAAVKFAVEVLSKVPGTLGSSGHGSSDGGLPHWKISGALERTEPPGFLLVRDSGLIAEGHPSDPRPVDPDRLDLGRRYLEDGDWLAAGAVFSRAADAQPSSWMLRYNAGISAFLAGDWNVAQADFNRAYKLLEKHDSRHPRHFAALVATRYSQGLTALREGSECEEGVYLLKQSINALKLYLESSPDLLARDVNQPFPVLPFTLDSYQVRNALVEAYLHCGRYPEEYFTKRSWAQKFSESEYSDPENSEIVEGPFPEELAACVGEEVPGRRCWALSNMNQLYHASEHMLPLRGKEAQVPARLRSSYTSLVQMALHIAGLIGQGPELGESAAESDRLTSADFLEVAARLNELVNDVELGARIEQFGRHLASSNEDFRLLALPYRKTPTSELNFGPENTAAELQGMAGAIELRCEDYLRRGTPDRIAEDLATVRGNLTNKKHLKSFTTWRRGVETTLQRALARALVLEGERDETAKALAIRGFRADFLGQGWWKRAWRAWMTSGRWVVLMLTICAVAALFIALFLIHRLVVFPYLVYTSRFYQAEFDHRHAECRKNNVPFTGDEFQQQVNFRD